MYKLSKDIVRWHIKTFAKATLETQLLKVNSEMAEMINATTPANYIEECADVCIASIALAERFNSWVGKHLLLKLFYDCDESKKNLLKQAIKRKMKINKKRTWKEDQHVE